MHTNKSTRTRGSAYVEGLVTSDVEGHQGGGCECLLDQITERSKASRDRRIINQAWALVCIVSLRFSNGQAPRAQ